MAALSAESTQTRGKGDSAKQRWEQAFDILRISEMQCSNQREPKKELSTRDWDVLLQSHQELLSDYLLLIQRTQQLHDFEVCAEIISRMFLNGIQSLLEWLLQKLPERSKVMIQYIDFARDKMLRTVQPAPTFTAKWYQCLGHLGWYRAQVGGWTIGDRQIWIEYSQEVLNQAADISPELGEIQHSLGKLACDDVLRQLFHYTKSLVCTCPSESARNTIGLFFNVCRPPSIISAFISSHRLLFNCTLNDEFNSLTKEFLGLLEAEVGFFGEKGQRLVYMTCCNLASMVEYGNPSAAMAQALLMNCKPALSSPLQLSQYAERGSKLAFDTLSILLQKSADVATWPSIHTYMAFVWYLCGHFPILEQVNSLIPWGAITEFLNNLLEDMNRINNSASRSLDKVATRQLPEDFLIRGQWWSRGYYPPGFFDQVPSEATRGDLEGPSAVHQRRLRLVYIGKGIETVGLTAS
ncbi:hypothetical protein N7523_005682 [Penicillium sp. IBT 18751x]|nr:hypothetical protein N7523_005682 [Penicillium sp. IBT 18751x]